MMESAEGPVIACIDGSSYLGSVCDHAATLAARLRVGVELLHVEEPPADRHGGAGGPPRPHGPRRSLSDPVVRDAAARLSENGAQVQELFTADGPFLPIAARLSRTASCVVVGRRGLSSERQSSGLGDNIERLLRHLEPAVCVAPKLHLPGRRALILFDERRPTRGYAGFLASHPLLHGLSFDVASVPSDDPGGGSACEGVVETLAQYFADHRCDLIVAPRSVFLDPAGDLTALGEALSAWRVPILFPPRFDA
ncbi:universal stress protein [Phenylobacterium sp.]|uniref:universal stress protein n=1 Tax=Phenylobacterium sp. TaxID=1871053 RepID=UPI002FE0AF0E